MDTVAPSKEKFALSFQREFKRKKADYEAAGKGLYGFRTAAKNIAAAHPTPAALADPMQASRQVDSYRKQLQRCWWGKFMPTEQTREIIAEELGCSPSVFGVGTDDAEPRLPSADLIDDLMKQIDHLERNAARLRKQVRDAMREGVAA